MPDLSAEMTLDEDLEQYAHGRADVTSIGQLRFCLYFRRKLASTACPVLPRAACAAWLPPGRRGLIRLGSWPGLGWPGLALPLRRRD